MKSLKTRKNTTYLRSGLRQTQHWALLIHLKRQHTVKKVNANVDWYIIYLRTFKYSVIHLVRHWRCITKVLQRRCISTCQRQQLAWLLITKWVGSH